MVASNHDHCFEAQKANLDQHQKDHSFTALALRSSTQRLSKSKDMAPLTSIRISEGRLEIVDQLLLPHTTTFLPVETIENAHGAIKTMRIRGAPAIASLAALAVALHLEKSLEISPYPAFLSGPQAFSAYINPILDFLYTARPTAVNLGAAIRRLKQTTTSAIDEGNDALEIARKVIKEAKAIEAEDVIRNKEMSRLGGEWLLEESVKRGRSAGNLNVMTVCNTGSLATSGYGTALGLITYLHETGKLQRAFFTQSTPYHQGSRLTALELQTLKIPSTMLCDSMVGSLFQHNDIAAVVVGADRIAHNGDTCE
ncbi:S-methyl-5-thioribose-1-phosphate isomerase [Cerrena zonata]|uniref:S-methyl-5-thioribose-1-phosphate isomerase n=1 Tax=Cerrena zonata TaxID=2478898 RepID=A0AAW0GDN0_9APHY